MKGKLAADPGSAAGWLDLRYSLNSLKGGYIGDSIGDHYAYIGDSIGDYYRGYEWGCWEFRQ